MNRFIVASFWLRDIEIEMLITLRETEAEGCPNNMGLGLSMIEGSEKSATRIYTDGAYQCRSEWQFLTILRK